MKRLLNLTIFGLLCLLVMAGFFYGNDIKDYFNKGEYHYLVIENKPTIISFFDKSKKDNNSHKKANELLASLGSKYKDKISTSVFTTDSDYATHLMEELKLTQNELPAMVLVNKNGYIISIQEGNIPVEKMDFDVSQVIK